MRSRASVSPLLVIVGPDGGNVSAGPVVAAAEGIAVAGDIGPVWRCRRVWQNLLAGTVILSAAKNLAYAGISARFFAAMKIGKSLAYASGYYFHRLWVPRSAMSNCARNDGGCRARREILPQTLRQPQAARAHETHLTPRAEGLAKTCHFHAIRAKSGPWAAILWLIFAPWPLLLVAGPRSKSGGSRQTPCRERIAVPFSHPTSSVVNFMHPPTVV